MKTLEIIEIKGEKGFTIIMNDNPIVHEETNPDSRIWKCGCQEGWGPSPSAKYYRILCKNHITIPAINRYDDFFCRDGYAITATRAGEKILLKKLLRSFSAEEIKKIAES